MSEKQETIAEIIAEMRIFKCRNLETGELELCNAIANYFADRLEAAWKREREGWEGAACSVISDAFQSGKIAVVNEPVGNAAKLREASGHVEKIAREFACGNYYISDFPKMLFDAIRPPSPHRHATATGSCALKMRLPHGGRSALRRAVRSTSGYLPM